MLPTDHPKDIFSRQLEIRSGGENVRIAWANRSICQIYEPRVNWEILSKPRSRQKYLLLREGLNTTEGS